jgi:universal stress protein A
MKKFPTPRSRSSAKLVVTEQGHKATAPASALIPVRWKVKRVLVPVDFSKHSRKALGYALGLAAQFGAEVTLVHIVEQTAYPGDWIYPLTASDFSENRPKLLEELKALTKNSGVTASHIVRLGRAWKDIVEIARERKSDLIIIGTHGYTGLRHTLMGSVAEKVVRHSPCPVLAVRPDDRDFA